MKITGEGLENRSYLFGMKLQRRYKKDLQQRSMDCRREKNLRGW